MLANTEAFIDVIRQGHPDVPIVVMTPVLRPDAERTPNRFGTDLRDIRASITAVVTERIDEYEDDRMWLVDGLPLLRSEHLPDGIHPGDEGHEILAAAFGDAVVEALGPGYAVR
jgi:lysophospholipase L1-like esterase